MITKLKSAVIEELVKDEALFYAIDSAELQDIGQADKLLYKHIFPYHKTPETITGTGTFITVQVHIRETSEKNKRWITPVLEIWIYSHIDHMKTEPVPEMQDNRNDCIARRLDQKWNGRSFFGDNTDPQSNVRLYESLNLTVNEEGAAAQNYLYRHMIFQTRDVNNAPCHAESW